LESIIKILKRDKTILNTLDMKDEKMFIVFSWLLEFRFSTPKILTNLLGLSITSTPRFFSGLIKNGFIKVLKNVHTDKERLYMLTQLSVDFLVAREIDVSNAVTKAGRLERYSMILHDIGVQSFVFSKISTCSEVVWDKNIVDIDSKCRPDALMKISSNGQFVGIEYERWRKNLKRIYSSFVNHSNQMVGGHYKGVYFIFNSESDKIHYQELFNSERWPLFSQHAGTGKLSHTGQFFYPDDIENIRRGFVFEVLSCE
jgi:hypothetical protein